MSVIEHDKMKYMCGFCGRTFKTCSECAKHIEGESIIGICFPGDIEIIEENVS